MNHFNLEDKISFTPKILYLEYILINYNDFLKDKLEDKNITQGELTFLYNIYYHEALSQRELADILHVSEAYVTKMLKKLENKRYIERKADDNNKSKKIIHLTDTGKSLTSDILELTKKWEENILKKIDYIDNNKLTRILYDFANYSHENK